jgi:NTP pyrophosphatase (non-canonical NTP hydrolase)
MYLLEVGMNLGEYQRAAFVTANKGMSENDMLTHAVLGLAGGNGEIVDLVKKFRFQGDVLDKTKLKEELGDVLWYVGLVASSMGVDLESVVEANIVKLRARYGR